MFLVFRAAVLVVAAAAAFDDVLVVFLVLVCWLLFVVFYCLQKSGVSGSETEMEATAIAFSEKFGGAADAAISTKTSDFR